MSEVLIYIGKVILIQGIFYGCYLLFLKNSLQHAWNRFYLILALISSFAIPFIKTQTPQVVEQWPAERVIVWVQETTTEFEMIPAVEKTPTTTYGWIIPAVYFAIVGFLLIRFALYLFFLQKLKKQSDYIKKHWYKLFKTTQPRPFSFFSSIFMPQKLFGSDAFNQVLAHECVHVKQRHSFDRLLLDFLVSLFWFNPFIYWYRNALIEIHEYQADEAVLKTYNDPVGYQEILYEQLQSASYSGLVSHFNFSMIKKRIVMMNKQKNIHTRWAYLLTLPVLFSVIFAFSTREAVAPLEEVGSEIADMLGPVNAFKIPDLSFSEIYQKKERETNEPSIMPIRSKDLVRLTSGFGMRTHPIFKVKKRHFGTDFSCKVGTEIIATADGVIELIQDKPGGYGKLVVIDHENGFKTRYAQLSEFKVEKGDRVKKGQIIALSGNSGMSTAPHLHYEIEKDGKHVDPMNYIKDYTPKPTIKEIQSQTESTNEDELGKEAMLAQEEAERAEIYAEREREIAEQEARLALLRKEEAELMKANAEAEKLRLILENSNQDGSGVRIKTDGNQPIYVIDGKIKKNINDLDPNQIKDITVLKGESAINKYGTKAVNGVIEVKTKIKIKSKTKKKEKSKPKNKTENPGYSKAEIHKTQRDILSGAQSFRVVIDAGHGGEDRGKVTGSSLNEKDFMLELAKEIRTRFKGQNKIDIILTRFSDEFVSWEDRKLAASGADLFISLHANNYEEHHDAIVWPLYSYQNLHYNYSKTFAELVSQSFKEISPEICVGSFTNEKFNMDEFQLVAEVDIPALLLNVNLSKISSDESEKTLIAEHLSKAIEQTAL